MLFYCNFIFNAMLVFVLHTKRNVKDLLVGFSLIPGLCVSRLVGTWFSATISRRSTGSAGTGDPFDRFRVDFSDESINFNHELATVVFLSFSLSVFSHGRHGISKKRRRNGWITVKVNRLEREIGFQSLRNHLEKESWLRDLSLSD